MIPSARRAPSLLPFLLALAASCAAAPASVPGKTTDGPPEEPPAPPSVAEVEVDPPAGALGTGKTIAARDEVALEGRRVDAKPGDLLLSYAGKVAVVSARGRLVDYGNTGGKDALVALDSILQIGLSIAETEVSRVELVGEAKNIARVTRSVAGAPLSHISFYFFGPSGALYVESVATASPEIEPVASPGAPALARRLPAFAVTLGEVVHWGNVPTWVEGAGPIHAATELRTAFVARDGLGSAYALCSADGPLFAKFGPPDAYGFFASTLTGERVVPVVHAGASERRRVAITTSQTSAGEAALALPCLGAGARRRALVPTALAPRGGIELSRCDDAGHRRIFARVAADRKLIGKTTIPLDLPEGCFEARLVAPGHAPGPYFRVDAHEGEADGRLQPSAGRLRVAVTEGKTPSPARLLVRGREGTPDVSWGDEPVSGAALNVAYLERGEVELPLPPGKYRVSLTRGFEYTAHEEDIEITPGREAKVRAELERVVDTKGYLAADLHLHAEPSPDAPTPLAERVRSLVAVGVEAAVATDHNAVTDYGPTIREMGLSTELASVVGDEVTTRDAPWGHFNVFPLLPTSPPLAWVGTLPAELFAEARSQKPLGANTIVQVNHPRMGGIGYFDLLRIDTADLKGFLARAPLADLGFDLLEVYNGDHSRFLGSVLAVMRDWYALLDAGFHTVATGNSDSHKAAYHEAGLPRNLVFVGNDQRGAFSEAAFVAALRSGNVSVSGGPFVRIDVGGKVMGETASAGEHDVTIRVDAPPWIDVDRIELVKNGALLRSFAVAGRKGEVVKVSREALAAGDWVIAIARGSKPMDAYAPGVLPFAFTNPVFVRNPG